jgi:hypothetical protein
MDAGSMRPRTPTGENRGRLDLAAAATWLLTFALVAFLGLEGGGYDPLVHDQVGIAVWWLLLVAVVVGMVPRRQPAPTALAAIALLGGFALWVVLSLIWTESSGRTFAEIARVVTYLGVFGIAVMTRDPRETQGLIGAVAAAIGLVVAVALLSRLEPGLIATAEQTGRLLGSEERLSYPLNYWNALAALTAIGVPLLLQIAAGAKSVLARALAAAAAPALVLTLYFTISRGGIGAAVLAVAIFVALAADRVQKLPTLAITGAGGAVLLALAASRDELRSGFDTALAHQQGDEMFVFVLAVGLVAGLAQAGVALASRRVERPGWTRPPQKLSLAALVVAVLALVVGAGALDAPGRAADAWDEFKAQEGGPGDGTERLSSVAGQSRYQFWDSAVDQNATAPLTGTGAGTFAFWWTREGDGSETVDDAHSLYLQTLGELGVVGLALLIGFLAFAFVVGARTAFLSDAAERSRLAAALAGLAAFAMTAAVDWMWQIPVLPVAALLLASVLVAGRGGRIAGDGAAVKPRLPIWLRAGVAALSLAAIALIALPLASETQLRESEQRVRGGDLAGALESAESARNAQPYTAEPRLQEALVLELMRDFGAAEVAAREATERERTNWRSWLVLSRIAAENGEPAASVAAYRRARSLNPHGEIFAR